MAENVPPPDLLDNVPFENRFVQNIIAAIRGYTGRGFQWLLTSYSHADNFAVEIQNLGTGGKALRVKSSAGVVLLTADDNGITITGGMTGQIIEWPGASLPTGFLWCDGSAVSRTTYAALFAICGIAFGAGDGSTTFNVPDKRDRVAGGVGTTLATLGTAYGANTQDVSHAHTPGVHTHDIGHTHTQPTHTHDTGHTHDVTISGNTGTSADVTNDLATVSPEEADASSKTHAHTFSDTSTTGQPSSGTSGAGGGDVTGQPSSGTSGAPSAANTGTAGSATQSVMQATLAVQFIIKY